MTMKKVLCLWFFVLSVLINIFFNIEMLDIAFLCANIFIMVYSLSFSSAPWGDKPPFVYTPWWPVYVFGSMVSSVLMVLISIFNIGLFGSLFFSLLSLLFGRPLSWIAGDPVTRITVAMCGAYDR